jgi:hypothetical protein
MLPNLSHLAAHTAGAAFNKPDESKREAPGSAPPVVPIDLTVLEAYLERISDPVEVYATLRLFGLNSKFAIGSNAKEYGDAVQKLANRPIALGGLGAARRMRQGGWSILFEVRDASAWRSNLVRLLWGELRGPGRKNLADAYFVLKRLERLNMNTAEREEYMATLTAHANTPIESGGLGGGLPMQGVPNAEAWRRLVIPILYKDIGDSNYIQEVYRLLKQRESLGFLSSEETEEYSLEVVDKAAAKFSEGGLNAPLGEELWDAPMWRSLMMIRFAERIQNSMEVVESQEQAEYEIVVICAKRTIKFRWTPELFEAWRWVVYEQNASQEERGMVQLYPPVKETPYGATLYQCITESDLNDNGAVRRLQYPAFSQGEYRQENIQL